MCNQKPTKDMRDILNASFSGVFISNVYTCTLFNRIGTVPIKEVSSFQRALCTGFNGVGTYLKMCPIRHGLYYYRSTDQVVSSIVKSMCAYTWKTKGTSIIIWNTYTLSITYICSCSGYHAAANIGACLT